jgi:hypothetical protein
MGKLRDRPNIGHAKVI